MLTSALGIRLVLLLGKTVPLPAPFEVMAALTEVEVNNNSETGDGFQMTFTLAKDKTFDYGLLGSGAFEPMNRAVIGVMMGAMPEVLIDGVISHHQIAPSNEPGGSTLTVSGKDISVMLDLEEKNAKYENQPDSVIAMRVIAQYAQYGLIPQATPTTGVPIMLQRIPRQQETDGEFLRRLAQRNGFVFYTEPLPFAISRAYWGPENRLGLPQPALSFNFGADSNVKTLSFWNDALAPIGTQGTFIDPIFKMAIPIPPLPSLKIPPLASSPAQAQRKTILRNTANQDFSQAATSAVAAVTNSPDAVRAQGELDAVRYGSVLRARRLVGVRGAGRSYDGNYYVKTVTHRIARGAYTQSFTLSREGTGTLLPLVMP